MLITTLLSIDWKSWHVSLMVGSGNFTKGLIKVIWLRAMSSLFHALMLKPLVLKAFPELVAPLRVVLVNYNKSIVYRLSKWRKHPFENQKLPPNPMYNFWDQSLSEFRGWFPAEWDQKPRLRQQWLIQRFRGNDMIKEYAPVTKELELESDSP